MGGPCDTLVVGKIYKYRNLAWKTEGKRPLWRPSLIWNDNVEVDLKDGGGRAMIGLLGLGSRIGGCLQ
jgi:hypothetical protein